ncbi:MAG: Hsp20/alpha crystallin family protein [Anaerolineae bacterium]
MHLVLNRQRGANPAYEDDSVSGMRPRRLGAEWLTAASRRTFRPPFDVYETEDHIAIKVEISGMREEDFAISLDGQTLRIAGRRDDSGDKRSYQRMEINYGDFELDIRLPTLIDGSGIDASYERGFLLVRIPQRAMRHQVPINGTGR